jgi:glycosyltransferase involved in cell wall biosynthesis
MYGLVSCIVTTYNRKELVSRAIDSVLAQSYSNIECIVVDDDSSDGTYELVNSYDDLRIIYIKNSSNIKLPASRNKGIQVAKGEYIAFLDDDDEWCQDKLIKQLDVYKSSELPKLGLVYTWMSYGTNDGNVQSLLTPNCRGNIFKYSIDDQPISACSTWMIKKTVFDDIGGFDESVPRGVDGDYLRQFSLKYEVDYVSEVLVRYHVDHGHQRMTGDTRDSIRRAIVGQQITLDKFKNKLIDYPKEASGLLAITAYDYSRIGEMKNCFSYFFKALKLYPTNIKIYKFIVRSALYKTGLL